MTTVVCYVQNCKWHNKPQLIYISGFPMNYCTKAEVKINIDGECDAFER